MIYIAPIYHDYKTDKDLEDYPSVEKIYYIGALISNLPTSAIFQIGLLLATRKFILPLLLTMTLLIAIHFSVCGVGLESKCFVRDTVQERKCVPKVLKGRGRTPKYLQ